MRKIVAVYLGALSMVSSRQPTVLGAVLAYIGIFAPGLALHSATMGVWSPLRRRSHRAVFACLRGVNATAVGLVYTAVYRLWETGFLDPRPVGSSGGSSSNSTNSTNSGGGGGGSSRITANRGGSLGADAFWVVVTTASYVGGMWFGLSPVGAIVMGAVLGLIWYGVTM